jgi:hypothetical protein
MAPPPTRFKAVLRKTGINYYVDLPANLADAIKTSADRRVILRIAASDGALHPLANVERARLLRIKRITRSGWFRTTIVPVKRGSPRLYVDAWMRATAKAKVGDTVEVTLRPDRGQRRLDVPERLRTALSRDAAAKQAWDAWSPSRRRSAVSYLNFLKSEDAVDRTILKILRELNEA